MEINGINGNSKDNNSNSIWKAQSNSFFKAKDINFLIF